jgi:hypothetical protein
MPPLERGYNDIDYLDATNDPVYIQPRNVKKITLREKLMRKGKKKFLKKSQAEQQRILDQWENDSINPHFTMAKRGSILKRLAYYTENNM